MRVLIQHCDSSKYLADDYHWVSKDREALNFNDGIQALKYIRKTRMKGLQLVLKFGDKKMGPHVTNSKK
jgi:hypothetical protein